MRTRSKCGAGRSLAKVRKSRTPRKLLLVREGNIGPLTSFSIRYEYVGDVHRSGSQLHAVKFTSAHAFLAARAPDRKKTPRSWPAKCAPRAETQGVRSVSRWLNRIANEAESSTPCRSSNPLCPRSCPCQATSDRKGRMLEAMHGQSQRVMPSAKELAASLPCRARKHQPYRRSRQPGVRTNNPGRSFEKHKQKHLKERLQRNTAFMPSIGSLK